MIDEHSLREILEDDLGCDLEGVGSDSLLFSTGLVDSFALVTLMTRLEQEAGIRIGPGDVTLENFDSIGRILAFLARSGAS